MPISLEKSGQEPIKGLPGKLTVYIAAGIFSVCKLLQGLMSFFASKQEHQLREDLIIMYAEVRSKAEDKVGVRLPKAYLSSFDTPRTLQGIIGIFAIGVGNWLISKDHVSYGLLACIAGAAVGSDAIQGVCIVFFCVRVFLCVLVVCLTQNFHSLPTY